MDKHFEGRFECLRCHKKYARLDALKRHSSEQFRPKLTWSEGMSTRAYNVTSSCVGGFETREWVELSGSRWLKPENVMHLRLPEPQDPLYPTISRLMVEAHRTYPQILSFIQHLLICHSRWEFTATTAPRRVKGTKADINRITNRSGAN